MILIGLGANLSSPVYGPPQKTLEAALAGIESGGIRVAARSPWYRSAPVPASDQPWFVNAVAELETDLNPLELLSYLQEIENRFGRLRDQRWEARIIDLDLLAYDEQIIGQPAMDSSERLLVLPHPRLAERMFVLRPLADLAPDWRHPVTDLTPNEMIERMVITSKVVPLQPED
jgi:2-amino-4-hydroxy-6-hydroxymethyldihydropteridine diphosphokinase